VSRPAPVPDGPAADARLTLPEPEHVTFDRLAGAVLATPAAPLGAVLRAHLPGTTGVRWLRQEGLPPTARPARLTSAHWLSLFACWSAAHSRPSAGAPGARRPGGRPSAHGHAPGAKAVPRWGS
jgi:hypothetical protein